MINEDNKIINKIKFKFIINMSLELDYSRYVNYHDDFIF